KIGLLLCGLLSVLMFWIEADSGRPLQSLLGVRCLLYEQMFGLAALSLGIGVGRRYLALFGPWQAALAAMGGALVGQAVLQVRCEAQGAAVHLLLFHVGGVLLASLFGAGAGMWSKRVTSSV